MQPPRALWVPFPLGRPLGKPADPAFQTKVILAALELLHREQGPVLEDFPHDAPTNMETQATACLVSFAARPAAGDSWQARLSSEFATLQPWYELSLRRRDGRTLVGLADKAPRDNVDALATLLDENKTPSDITWLKYAVEDIKAFYFEAMTAQPGDYDSDALQHQFWQESSLGAAILAFHDLFNDAQQTQMKLVARLLAPREAVADRDKQQAKFTGGHSND